MKLSEAIQKMCKENYKEFTECVCPIKDLCKDYRKQYIYSYEEFREAFYKMENKIRDEIKK